MAGAQDAMNVDSYAAAPGRVVLVGQGMDTMERKERRCESPLCCRGRRAYRRSLQTGICTRRSQRSPEVRRADVGPKFRYSPHMIALDDRIEDIAEIVQKHYGLADLGDPSAESEVRLSSSC